MPEPDVSGSKLRNSGMMSMSSDVELRRQSRSALHAIKSVSPFYRSAWTGMPPAGWPNPKDHPFPLPLHARESQRKDFIAGGVGSLGCALLLALVLLRLIDIFAYNRSSLGGVLLILAGLVGIAFLLAAGGARPLELQRFGVCIGPSVGPTPRLGDPAAVLPSPSFTTK